MANDAVRAGVVGVGYLGRFHAEKYAALPGVDLVGVADIRPERAREVGERLQVPWFTDHRALFGRVRCVSLAVPTALHYELAREFLENGIDVLVEKPITATAEQGRRLVELARSRGLILQVGHLERFNPAIRSLDSILTAPRFIECHRLAPFAGRGTDVDVIRDLMIHDLDVILSFVPAGVERAEAVGVPVLSPHADIANARIRFRGGAIANITASRVALKRERKIRFFQPDAYVSVDYGDRRILICRRRTDERGNEPQIDATEIRFGEADPLFEEIEAFVDAVRTRGRPLVDGETALRALEVAEFLCSVLETT